MFRTPPWASSIIGGFLVGFGLTSGLWLLVPIGIIVFVLGQLA